MWNSSRSTLQRAGPLDRRSNQPGTGDGNSTRLRRIWQGYLFPPPEASA